MVKAGWAVAGHLCYQAVGPLHIFDHLPIKLPDADGDYLTKVLGGKSELQRAGRSLTGR